MAQEEKKIDFGYEVEIAGKKYNEVTMQVPKGKHLRGVSHIRNVTDRDLTLAANLCGLNATPEDFDEVEGKVVLKLQKALQDFLL